MLNLAHWNCTTHDIAFKVHVLSRWLVGNVCARKISCDFHYCEPLSSELLPMIISQFCVKWITCRNLCRFSPFVWPHIKNYCNTLSSLELISSSCCLIPSHWIVCDRNGEEKVLLIYMYVFILHYFCPFKGTQSCFPYTTPLPLY